MRRSALAPDHESFTIFPAFEGGRVGVVEEEVEVGAEVVVELVAGDAEGGAFFDGVVGVEKKDAGEMSAGFEDLVEGAGVVRPAVRGDGAEAGVLPGEVVGFFFGPREEVADLPIDIWGRMEFACFGDGCPGEVEGGDLRGMGGEEGGVVPESATGMEDAGFGVEEIRVIGQKKREGRMGHPFFPRCLTVAVTRVPVDGRHVNQQSDYQLLLLLRYSMMPSTIPSAMASRYQPSLERPRSRELETNPASTRMAGLLEWRMTK